MKITDDNIHGRVVLSGDGIAIGEISRLHIDGDKLAIATFEVRLRKGAADRLGFSRSVFHRPTLEIPTTMVQSIGDAVLLVVPLDDLRKLRKESHPVVKPDEQPAAT